MGDSVLYERKNNVGVIKLNRPQVLNAVSDELVEDFIGALHKAKNDPEARVIILKGEGRAFCAGADLKEGVIKRSMEQYRNHVIRLQEIGHFMLRMDKPIIGAIHGFAVGAGLEFSCNCDLRIAAEGTQFFSPETNVGATVTTGGAKLLPSIVGIGRAFELFFTNRRLGAKEAQAWGLVNKVVPLEELDKAAMEMAEDIAGNYSLALALNRVSLYHGLGASLDDVLDEEISAACISFASGERQTGMRIKR